MTAPAAPELVSAIVGVLIDGDQATAARHPDALIDSRQLRAAYALHQPAPDDYELYAGWGRYSAIWQPVCMVCRRRTDEHPCPDHQVAPYVIDPLGWPLT